MSKLSSVGMDTVCLLYQMQRFLLIFSFSATPGPGAVILDTKMREIILSRSQILEKAAWIFRLHVDWAPCATNADKQVLSSRWLIWVTAALPDSSEGVQLVPLWDLNSSLRATWLKYHHTSVNVTDHLSCSESRRWFPCLSRMITRLNSLVQPVPPAS